MTYFNDDIFIIPSENSIAINNETLWFDYIKPDKILNINIENISQIWWKSSNESKIVWYEGELYASPMHETVLDETEEIYNTCIKTFADQYQAEKDRIEQEQQQAQEEYAKFSSRQLRAYDLVKTNYQSALDNAPVVTSLGFNADISTESTATLLGSKLNLDNGSYDSVNFVDYYDIDREIDSTQINIILSEINQAQNHLRNQKQDYIAQIKNTYDNDSLNAILPTLKFTTLDFTQDVDPANEDNVKQYKEVEITIKQCDMLNTIDNM